MRCRIWLLAAALAASAWAGCATPVKPPDPGPQPVTVAPPVLRDVVETVEFTGRTAAVYSTDMRARVTGYLVGTPFKEGAEVKKNDVLFEIDPRPYQAQLDRAKGDVTLQEAKLKLAIADNARAKNIFKMNPGAISQQDLDKYQAAEEEAKAAVEASKANLESYRLNLEFCRVISPIDGQVGRYDLTVGNLVNQDQTILTTVVSVDPMYAYFDVDEATLLRVRRAVNEGKIKRSEHGADGVPVSMGLQGEEGPRGEKFFPHAGTLNYISNQLNPLTGTITVRGSFPNPVPKGGVVRLLAPNLFARVRLPLGPPSSKLLVPDVAVATDQGLKNVFVVDGDNKVQYRRVTLGALQDDGMRVIEDGLKPEDRVVVAGIQLVRQGMTVIPEAPPEKK